MWTFIQRMSWIVGILTFLGFAGYDLFDLKPPSPQVSHLVDPQKIDDKSAEEVAKRQVALEEELRRLRTDHEEELRRLKLDLKKQPGQRRVSQVRNQVIDVAGAWQAGSGSSWQIQQAGSKIAFQELHPVWGSMAVGQGIIRNREIRLNYVSLLGMPGEATLTVSDDGKALEGNARDLVIGTSIHIKVSRE